MLESKRIATIEGLDNDIDFYRSFLKLMGKSGGANPGFDSSYALGLDIGTALLVAEKNRLKVLIKKALNKKIK
jgi:hypothetical protein